MDLTVIVVPSFAALGLIASFSLLGTPFESHIFPSLYATFHPHASPRTLVVTLILETNEMDARASPRKP